MNSNFFHQEKHVPPRGKMLSLVGTKMWFDCVPRGPGLDTPRGLIWRLHLRVFRRFHSVASITASFPSICRSNHLSLTVRCCRGNNHRPVFQVWKLKMEFHFTVAGKKALGHTVYACIYRKKKLPSCARQQRTFIFTLYPWTIWISFHVGRLNVEMLKKYSLEIDWKY